MYLQILRTGSNFSREKRRLETQPFLPGLSFYLQAFIPVLIPPPPLPKAVALLVKDT